MSDENAVIQAAEAIVQGAADRAALQLDACALPLKLAAEQLSHAARVAQDALAALYVAAEAYAPLQAEAHRQAAAAGLSAPHRPDGASPFDSAAERDGLLVLHGTAYAAFSPAEILLRTTASVLSESGDLPAGARLGIQASRPGGGQ